MDGMDLDRDQQLGVDQLVQMYGCSIEAASEAMFLTPNLWQACDCFDEKKGAACLEHWRAINGAAMRAGRREFSLRNDGAGAPGASTDALATPPPAAASSPLTEPDSEGTLPSSPPVPPPPQLDEDKQEMTKAFKNLYNENPAAAVSWLEQMFSDVALAQLPLQDKGNGKRKSRDEDGHA